MRRVGNRLFDLTGCRGKTLWDWMGLLIVPLFLAGATVVLSLYQQRIEDDRARQSVLESYLQNMTTLLLDKGLAESSPNSSVREVARSSTLAAVRQLDGERKGILLQFLSESNLITTIPPIPPIISLSGANLIRANLYGANLGGADLSNADLTDADLSNADLNDANLYGAKASVANLISANLGGANLYDANLNRSKLGGANLSGASLIEASLLSARLFGANLGGANLSNASLFGANLSGARNLTNQQLAQAKSLVGATLPNGMVIETEQAWEKFKKLHRK